MGIRTSKTCFVYNNIFEFKNSSGTNRGQIRGVSSTVVAYDTSSDRRLKKDIQDMPSMYNTVKNLKPSKFTWKENNQDDYGFIAQEVYSTLPNLRGDIPYCDITDSKFDIENRQRMRSEISENGEIRHLNPDEFVKVVREKICQKYLQVSCNIVH